ncbi:VanW family protein [Anaerobacillus alkaliphilus]|nr:VanW family protein [Anaerobacillus alkaliphilus]
MKKVIIVITSLFLLTGCVEFLDQKETNKISIQANLIRELDIRSKEELSLSWDLVDGRTNDVLVKVSLSELGFQKGNGLEEDKVIKLAKQLASNIDQPLLNPTITRDGVLKEGKNRVILSERELVNKMMSLYYYNKYLVLPIYEEVPQVTLDDLKTIKHSIIGSYVTYFNPNVSGRSINIKLSSQAIDHFVLAPNEIFSFNKVVGQRTTERGYQEAMEIVNKEFVVGVGGGICQTSSTLYNAVDKAGMEIIERYSHSRDIGYVPQNRDATVSWGGPDFKFKNPYDFPLLISTDVNLQTGKIEVQIYASQQPTE